MTNEHNPTPDAVKPAKKEDSLASLLPHSSNAEITPVENGLETVLGFFDLDAFGLSLQENGFTSREYYAKLLALCDSPDEKTRLAALREFRAVRREVLEHNGLIAKTHQTVVSRRDDGTEVRASASASRLMQSLTKVLPHVQEGVTIHRARTSNNPPGIPGTIPSTPPDFGTNTPARDGGPGPGDDSSDAD